MSLNIKTVTIASGTGTSSLLELKPDEVIVSIQTSATFDATAIAIHGNLDGSTTVAACYDIAGNAISITTSDNSARVITIPPEFTLGLSKVKLVANQNQDAASETVYVGVRSDR